MQNIPTKISMKTFALIAVFPLLLAVGCKKEIKNPNQQQTLVIINNIDIPDGMRSKFLIGTVKHPYSYGCIDAFNKSKIIMHENSKKISKVEFLIPKICLKSETLDSARTLLFEKDSLAEIDFYYSYIQTQSTKIKDTLIINNVSNRRITIDE